MVGVIFVYADTVFGFYGLVGCFSMVIWTPAVLSVLYACVVYSCICTSSAQLRMFHMERRSIKTLIITIIIMISVDQTGGITAEDVKCRFVSDAGNGINFVCVTTLLCAGEDKTKGLLHFLKQQEFSLCLGVWFFLLKKK